jgi:HEAT repeat protein
MAWKTWSRVGFISIAVSFALILVIQGAKVPQDNAPADPLKTRLYSTDQDTSALAFAELVRSGKSATPTLLEALRHSTPRTRRLAAEGLAEVRDPASADALEQATHDSNGEVRSRAAVALHLLGDPRALAALVRTIDDYPDILHNPYTASMYELTGDPAVLPLIAPLLKAPQPVTRQRAFLVVKALAAKLPEGRNWDQLSQSLGNYDPQGEPAARDRSADLWTAWIRKVAPAK